MKEINFETNLNDVNSGFVFTMGGDPEFVFVRNGNQVSYNAGRAASFGSDCGNAEIRGFYAVEPEEVVAQIKNILKSGYRENRNYAWVAGTIQCGNALGGHIHLKVKNREDKEEIVKLLDYYVDSLIGMVEPRNDRLARINRTPYGKGWRDGDSWDVVHGLEWRSPTSWLGSERLTLAVYVLIKIIVWEYYNGDRAMLLKNKGNRIIDTVNKVAEMKKIWKVIKNCKLYRFNKYFRKCYYLRKLIEKGELMPVDVKKGWNLEPVRQRLMSIERYWATLEF